FGKSIVVEKKYGNFGYWSNPEDHAIWTVEVPKIGRYDVWIYYACDPKSAGNTLVIQTGLERVKHEVYSTGSWDEYRGVKIGDLQLAAGKQEIVVRSQGAIRGAALADLKK